MKKKLLSVVLCAAMAVSMLVDVEMAEKAESRVQTSHLQKM